MAVFRVFYLGYVSDPASFTITKIEVYKKNFDLKYYGYITPRNAIYNFEGVPQTLFIKEPQTLFINTSSFCYFHTKINSKYTGITVTGRIFSGNLKK